MVAAVLPLLWLVNAFSGFPSFCVQFRPRAINSSIFSNTDFVLLVFGFPSTSALASILPFVLWPRLDHSIWQFIRGLFARTKRDRRCSQSRVCRIPSYKSWCVLSGFCCLHFQVPLKAEIRWSITCSVICCLTVLCLRVSNVLPARDFYCHMLWCKINKQIKRHLHGISLLRLLDLSWSGTGCAGFCIGSIWSKCEVQSSFVDFVWITCPILKMVFESPLLLWYFFSWCCCFETGSRYSLCWPGTHGPASVSWVLGRRVPPAPAPNHYCILIRQLPANL